MKLSHTADRGRVADDYRSRPRSRGSGVSGLCELPVERFDVAIVGGGPGGLAVSQQLAARRISNVVLERGDHAGWMWGQVYDSLRLHTGKHLSSLPGMPFPAHTSLFPTRSEFAEYLESYVDRFQLPVRHRG